MPPSSQQVEAGRGDDDVGLELGARLQPDAVLGERLDLVGDDRGAPAADRLEQVAVGHQAHALVPRVVARAEVGVDVVAGRELALDALAEHAPSSAPGAGG